MTRFPTPRAMCRHCDVTWSGLTRPCWVCGRPGQLAAPTIALPDDIPDPRDPHLYPGEQLPIHLPLPDHPPREM